MTKTKEKKVPKTKIKKKKTLKTKSNKNYECSRCKKEFKTQITLKPLKMNPTLKCCKQCRRNEALKIRKEYCEEKKKKKFK